MRALRNLMPSAEITWITSPLAHSLLSDMPGVHFEVIDKPRTLANYLAFYQAFRHRKFDVVLAMQANFRINLLYPSLHAPIKIGFDRVRAREGQWFFCNRQIPFRDMHLVDSFLSFIEVLTGETTAPIWGLPVDESDLFWAREKLASLPKPWIAIHPHSSKEERNWLPDRYAQTIAQIFSRRKAGFLLTGGNAAAELALCRQLEHAAPTNIVNLCGKTNPKQLAALLSLADVLIAPDTGAIHIARSMGIPVIGLYAVASPELTGPYRQLEYCVNRYPLAVRKFLGKNPECLPWNTRVHHPDAMSLITIDDVMQQLVSVLDKK